MSLRFPRIRVYNDKSRAWVQEPLRTYISHLKQEAEKALGIKGGLWSLEACTRWHLLLQQVHTPNSSTDWEPIIWRYEPMGMSFSFKALHLVTSFCFSLHSCKNINKNKLIKTNKNKRLPVLDGFLYFVLRMEVVSTQVLSSSSIPGNPVVTILSEFEPGTSSDGKHVIILLLWRDCRNFKRLNLTG